MSSVNKLSVLAFASTVLATPFAGQHHGHQHAHRGLKGYGAPFPYPSANTTSVWGTTGVASSYSSASSSAATPAGYTSGGHDTLTSTLFQTVYSTVSVAYQSSSASPAGYGSGSGSGSSDSGDQCAADVTVTSTEKVYVTVTAGQTPGSSESSPVETSSVKPTSTIHITQTVTPSASAPAYTAPSSSSPAAPVSSSSSAPAYSAPSSSSESSPVSYSTPASSSSESSSSAYPILTAYTEAQKEVAHTSTASAPASYTSSASTSGGKRGLAYNTASLITCFDNSDEITWAYNWVSASAGLTGNLNFVPTLHDGSDTFTSVWSTEASASIASGSKTLFSFNEPDEPSQANMSPATAAEMYIKYMNPFAGKASLCAPSVTNGPASENMGLTWLQEFIDACDGKCHIDCYNIHWYAPADADGFKDHVTQAISMAGEKPVWVSEYGCTGASDDEVNSFLEEVMPWMDSNDSVAGYAYFMAADGTLMSGTEPSTYGKTYMSYSG